jgi:hypothetical protein
MTTKTQIKIRSGEIIKVGDMFNGTYYDDTCGAYVVAIHKPYSRWLIKLQSFDNDNTWRNLYACKFHKYNLKKL